MAYLAFEFSFTSDSISPFILSDNNDLFLTVPSFTDGHFRMDTNF
jgi:hypothetical protein